METRRRVCHVDIPWRRDAAAATRTYERNRRAPQVLDGDKYEDDATTTCAVVEGVDALIWQLAASVALPGYTIHQLVAVAVALLGAADLTGSSPIIDALPTALGLATTGLKAVLKARLTEALGF